ncbi:hypothetical protein DFH08DRAFT_1073434 [Mycena albidolilacea]|uniref:F-box domain-containing protein n=1 Tax=Mycena albidolilacea TaxID=1033008 RepID=A0AAD7AQ43_9AGAR|nr:hypothetical protein DFH08DRAFT_1073434 [Mycena albidolilacea]
MTSRRIAALEEDDQGPEPCMHHESPFADRLNTNYIPSDSEIVEIRTLLADPVDELARVEARIEELEIALSQLKELRASLKTPIDAHRALISPMRCIPQDVLLAIFSSCLPSEHNALIDPAEAPLVLGRICRHWRDVAYSTPILWSSIHIPCLGYLHVPPNMISGLERTVETWLERSSACPLSVSFFDVNNSPLIGVEKNPLILRLLPISRRLGHLTLFGAPEFLRPILRLGSENLPALKSISIQTVGNQLFGDDPDQLDSTNALQIPTLEDVTLQISSNVDPLALPLKWSRLTRIRLECSPMRRNAAGGLDIGGAFEVLRRCPNLVHCEIRVTARTAEGPTLDTSPIILPHLRTLVLSGIDYQFQSWMTHLVVPKLRALRLGDVATKGPAIGSSAPQDGCMSADIDTGRFTSSGLHELLQSFPTISHLRLSSTNIQHQLLPDDAFIDLLHNLCPIMTNITLLLASSVGLSDAAVLAFVKARMALPTPLQQFWARFGRARELDIMLEVQSFILDGLEVTLEYPGLPQWKFRPQEGLDALRTS